MANPQLLAPNLSEYFKSMLDLSNVDIVAVSDSRGDVNLKR
jgi:hypothetical protein